MISWGIAESVNLLEGRVSSPAVSILAACGNVWCGVLEYWCDIVGGGAGSIWSGRVCIGSWNALFEAFGSWCSEFCNGVGGIRCGSCGVTNGNGGGWVWRRWGQRGTWGGVFFTALLYDVWCNSGLGPWEEVGWVCEDLCLWAGIVLEGTVGFGLARPRIASLRFLAKNFTYRLRIMFLIVKNIWLIRKEVVMFD